MTKRGADAVPLITRTWLALAALGAALIHLAIGAGSPLPLAIPLIALGVSEFIWGILTLIRERTVTPKAALAGSMLPLAGWGLLATVTVVFDGSQATAPLPVLPMAVATVFGLFMAAVLLTHRRRLIRRGVRSEKPAPEESGGRYILALFTASALVAVMTTPALAATEAGLHAVPHGEHAFIVDEPGHSH